MRGVHGLKRGHELVVVDARLLVQRQALHELADLARGERCVRPCQLGVGSEERRAEVGRREGTRVVGVEAAEGLADEHVVGPYGGADVLHERRVCPAERARCGGGGARRLLGLRLGDLVELEQGGEGEVVDAALVRGCSTVRGVAW